jgi:PAS domain S-box-containing protein
MLLRGAIPKPAHILIVEERHADLALLQQQISTALPNSPIAHIDTRDEYLAKLIHFQPDLIIAADQLPGLDGLTVLQLAQEHAPHAPVIILAGALDEVALVTSIKAGATDYVSWQQIERLGPAITAALNAHGLGAPTLPAAQPASAGQPGEHGSDAASPGMGALQMQATLHLTQFCVDHASVGIIRTGANAHILSVNNEMCRLLGYSAEELCALQMSDIDPAFPIERWNAHCRELRARGSRTLESTYRRRDGTLFPTEIASTYLEFQGSGFVITFVHDISDRKKAEETQARLEQQLLQSQKMESIGRLAGGVAHDFNNLLTVIQGYCALMEEELPPESALLEELGQIQLASERAAALTRQLLAFSRKQILSPVVLDLNDLVANLRKMLERLISEDIALTTQLAPSLRPVIADPGQIEQVIVNLAINARDAMPTGGTLIIETGNLDLDQSYAATHPEAPTGACVMLTVTDTGYGMDARTQARIFEPFFTTKEAGKGTGLGLATVYGIVKQSGGEINVASELNRGTTFQIVLPASAIATSDQVDQQPHPAATGGSETILLVEDEPLVRELVRAVLRNEGYTILEAADGREALRIAGQHHGPIDLLVTDVVMPEMSGRELAEQLSLAGQPLKVLFMSGYTDDAVVRHGLRVARVHFLAKPFSPLRLAAKVREVLDQPHGAPIEESHTYYDEARGALNQTLDMIHGATNTRSFAQAMVVQGNVLAMIGDLRTASDYFTRSRAIYQALGDRSNQAAALERLGWVSREQDSPATAFAYLEEALALYRQLGDRHQIAWVLLTMAEVSVLQEDPSNAETLIDQALALNPESHDWVGWSLNHLGHAAQLRREYDRAEHLHRKTLTVFIERLGDKSTGIMWAYQGLGETALGQELPATAHRCFLAALRLARELGARIIMAWCIAGLGTAAALEGDLERAAKLWGAAEQLRIALGCRPAPAARATYERQVELARAPLGARAFASAWAVGENIPIEQLIADLLADAPDSALPAG